MYINVETPCCIHEINVILYDNNTSIKFFKFKIFLIKDEETKTYRGEKT